METVNEKTTAILAVTFKDENGNLVTPTTGSYRIDDYAGTQITGDTAFTPSSSTYEITISANENRILDANNLVETRIATVSWTYSGSKQGTSEYIYQIKNLRKIT